jgi:hypothetical protein
VSILIFLGLRALHVLLAAIWIGSTVFISVLMMPAIEQSGPAGGEVMMNINARGLTRYMAILGGTTVLTGIYLFWRFTGGFDPETSATHAGIAFGVGGAAGILAAVIGGSVVGRSANKAIEIMSQVARLQDGPDKSALMKQVAVLQQRMKSGGSAVIVLQAIALLLMAVAHYI